MQECSDHPIWYSGIFFTRLNWCNHGLVKFSQNTICLRYDAFRRSHTLAHESFEVTYLLCLLSSSSVNGFYVSEENWEPVRWTVLLNSTHVIEVACWLALLHLIPLSLIRLCFLFLWQGRSSHFDNEWISRAEGVDCVSISFGYIIRTVRDEQGSNIKLL